MRISDILYCSLLGLCNYVILREMLTYGFVRTLAQGFANPGIRIAVFFGLLITLAGGVFHRMADFNPNMKSVFNWSLVFIFPFILALISKAKLDPGWSSLEKGKALWKSQSPRLTYQDGVVEEHNTALRDDPCVIQAKSLIQRSIELAPSSNMDRVRASANAAIAWQELGLLHRVVNEFQEAEVAFRRSLELLDQKGGVDSIDRNILAAYRETCFRLGELFLVTSRCKEADEYCLRSLAVDEKLGHDDPVGEQVTRNLLEKSQERG